MVSSLLPQPSHFSKSLPAKDNPTGSLSSDHQHNKLDGIGLFDVSPIDMPNNYDILLSDIDEKVLSTEISAQFGMKYLSETSHLTSPRPVVDGIVHGRYKRVLFPLVVQFPRKPCSFVIYFLYDSGSPNTFLSKEACDLLFGTNPTPAQFYVQINFEKIEVNKPNSGSHFEHVNLLGTDFSSGTGVKITVDYKTKTAKMHFPSNFWD